MYNEQDPSMAIAAEQEFEAERQAELDSDYADHLAALQQSRTGVIHYGFGKEYLTQWGLKEAMREVYQNFIDYGFYASEMTGSNDSDIASISVQNGWQPVNLDFLRIGKSEKGNNLNTVGKHGEGLKMAFLIFLRMGLKSVIITPNYQVWPDWYVDKEIGECFCLRYEHHEEPIDTQFTINFECPAADYKQFIDNVITDEQVIFTDNYWGEIVDKPAGSIYSGRLFVAKLDNIGKAYNIQPRHMQLDRDRAVPRAFDVNYASSKINQSQGKLTAKDLTYSDAQYIDSVPEAVKKEFKPVRVGNDIQFSYKVNGETKVLANHDLKEKLKGDSFFAKAINGIKRFLAKQLGVYDLMVDFKQKYEYYLPADAKKDLEIILEKVNQ